MSVVHSQGVAAPREPIVTGHFHCQKRYAVLRKHGSTDWLLIYTIRGQGYFLHGQNRHSASPGDLVLLRPHLPHGYGIANSHWEMIWAHFLPKTDWSSLLKWPKVSPGLMRLTLPVQRRGVLLKIFKKVDRLSRAAVANRSALALNALEELLLLCLNENPYSAAAPLDPRIESTINYLSDHFAAKIAVPQLAAKCGLSVSRFAHLFHEQIGLPPLRYLEERRLSRARQLLDVTKLSVAEIAFQIGYHSPFHFSRRFKAFSGKSPISYRNQNA